MEKRTGRKTNRSTYEVQVTITYDNHCLVGKSKDISAGGMFIYCDEYPGFDREVTLQFDLPSIEPAQLRAMVRWHNDSGFGVQFMPIGAKLTHEINKICAHCGK